MTLEEFQEDRYYVVHKLAEAPGMFLRHFLEACLSADPQNYELLRPTLQEMKRKYPLRKEFLTEEI